MQASSRTERSLVQARSTRFSRSQPRRPPRNPRVLLYSAARASQINGCSVCVDIPRAAPDSGEAASHHGCSVAGGAVLQRSRARRVGVTEAATRLADRPDPVPDEVWEEAAHHYARRSLPR